MAGMEAGTEKGDGMLRSPNLGLLRCVDINFQTAKGARPNTLHAYYQHINSLDYELRSTGEQESTRQPRIAGRTSLPLFLCYS